MAIFSRRILQAMLDENSRWLSSEQLQVHVNRLNGKDPDQRVSTEWEVAVVNAANKLVSIKFEPPMRTGRKPDILLTLGDQEALADITVVSDRGLHEANPIQHLHSEFFRRLRKLRLDPNKFSVQVGGNHTQLWLGGDAKATLKLPHSSKFKSDIFGKQFWKFAHAAMDFPQQPASMEISTQQVQVRFGYKPDQRFFTGSHLSYTVTHLLHNNPLFNRLERKTEQLRKVNYEGTLGIIVCDGGCALLNDLGQRGKNYGCRDVVKEFFRCHPGVGFVQIISIKTDFPTVSKPNRPRVVSTLYPNTKTIPLLLHELSRIHEKLPDAEATPYSAYHQRYRSCGRSFAGGWEFNGNMRISVRMLQEMLAGRITSAEFLEAHRNFQVGNGTNIFDLKLGNGQLISRAEIVSGDTRDDDWIEFKFSEPDPAISPLRMPRDQQ